MGIDAEMFVRVKRAVPDDEVRMLRRRLGDAFGADSFWIFRGNGATGESTIDEVDDDACVRSRHSIERITVYTQDGDDIVPEPGETFLRVYIASRFYGPGYERGNLPLILAIADFLRRLTDGEVWYGGDSSGICAQPLNNEYRAELWEHFVKHGHAPYFSDFGGEGIPRPHCAMCGNAPMRFFGTGQMGKRAAASCSGCGAQVETIDGGDSWHVYKEGA